MMSSSGSEDKKEVNPVLAEIYATKGERKENVKSKTDSKGVQEEKKKRGRKKKEPEPKKEEPKETEQEHEEDEEDESGEEEIDVDEILEELKAQKDEMEEMSLRLRLVEDFLSYEWPQRVKDYRDAKSKQFRELAELEEEKKEEELDRFLGTTPRIKPKKTIGF